jgi:hypothetical protein
LVVTHAWGQSNDRIDELLAQDPAEAGHTAYLVLTAAGLIDEDASPSEAARYAVSEEMLAADIGASDATTFGAFSYLLTRSFDIPGGVMYRIAPGPRYAAREVVYQRWSRQRRETGELINGETVIRILSVYLNDEGGAQ